MINTFVNLFKNIALRHKGVKSFRYQGDDFNNAQHNYDTFQVYLDDVSYHNLNITNNVFTSEFNLYILSKTDDENKVENIQTKAFTIAVDILGYLDSKNEYHGILKLHDYSIITLSNYTAQRNCGVKLSVVLETPSPLNLCSIDDNFNDEPYEEEQEVDLDIKVIDLPKTRRC